VPVGFFISKVLLDVVASDEEATWSIFRGSKRVVIAKVLTKEIFTAYWGILRFFIERMNA